jgi:short subunit dehydrogenase-like uncharacterized protein
MTNEEEAPGRQYDIVVWGASGFTGRLVVEYLHERYKNGGDLQWAVAGRNPQKLQQVLDGLSITSNAPDILLADSHDSESLRQLACSTRVVLTTVGPYALYGSELVEACVKAGTHYCDLAGEVHWMRKMIDMHQEAAQESGARIVHTCGFDSIPSDLGVQFLQQYAEKNFGAPCTRIDLLVKAIRGGGSGGTIASALNALDEAGKDREIARIMTDPYSLNPEGERQGPDGRDQRGVEYNELAGRWTAPFIMAVINMRVVRRSNALMDYAYGKEFEYNESMLSGKGASGWLKAATITAGLGGFMLASSFSLSRSLLVEKMIPKPGEGPDKSARESGFFNLMLFGKLGDGTVLRARVTGDRDPGYGSTSKMLSESAICLAMDDITVGGGFWTPASAMGALLRQRMVENAGLTFEIE